MQLVDIVGCRDCNSNGCIEGGGMILKDCPNCHGTGQVEQIRIKQALTYIELTKTKAYEDRIIKLIAEGNTRQQAIIIIANDFHADQDEVSEVKPKEIESGQKRKYTKRIQNNA